MKFSKSLGFWQWLSGFVLRNRTAMLTMLLLITIFFTTQWKYIHFTHSEANLLPDDNEVNIAYNSFLKQFGEEGNLIVIGTKDEKMFSPKTFANWQKLMHQIQNHKEIDLIISFDNLKVLAKDTISEQFVMRDFVDKTRISEKGYLSQLRNNMFVNLPFYEGLLFNKNSKAIRAAIYMNKKIVNTPERKFYILNTMVPLLEKFEKENQIDLRVSGMPYIRTLNAKTILGEISIFIGAALLVTGLLFFFFFRSIRTTIISMFIVIIGVLWSFGFLGLFHYEITVLTALVPTLMIVIGVPNCIFLINKYHQEYKVHGNKAKALQRVTTKIGMATLMTNLTTAIGFATFITSNNKLLIEFGVVTGVNIMAIFALCMIAIPIFLSFLPAPKPRHIKHLDRVYVQSFMDWILFHIKHSRIKIYIISSLLLFISIIGICTMRISGSLIEDMPKKEPFFKDIVFYENEFEGVMPLEIMINTNRPKGVMKLSVLKRMEELQKTIDSIPELSKPISVVNIVKYAKQAYYNSNPEYYDLPTPQEQAFILTYAKNATKGQKDNLLKSYVDDKGQYARITTFMRDESGDRIPIIEDIIRKKADKLFPPNKYQVTITGKALVFQKGTGYLLDNLLSSLIFAFFLTAILVGFMFKSTKMVMVSIIPNLLPLLLTAGLMGFLNIPLKPSTILVFGIAFGLSVDDTIRFLSQYREELIQHNWHIRASVYATFKGAGLSMFYTSIVLFFGFSVFMLSSFGGTIALGGLISLTLCFGMLSNLMLLPALVLTLNRKLANKQELENPMIDIAEHSDAEIDALQAEEENN